jgi:hypothetical protein
MLKDFLSASPQAQPARRRSRGPRRWRREDWVPPTPEQCDAALADVARYMEQECVRRRALRQEQGDGAAPALQSLQWWLVQFDCEEAVLVQAADAAALMDMRDDFDCAPREILPVSEVEFLDDRLWTKNGWLRCGKWRRKALAPQE